MFSKVSAQATPAPPPPAAKSDNAPQRETRPDLTIDSDPVRSPDIDAANTSAPAGQVQRDKDGTYSFHVDVNEVLLDLTVVDEKGRPVLDLNRGDFRVFEDDVPQSTVSFVHQDQPVAMGILIDNSGSMLDKRGAVNAAAMKLLTESNPSDAAFVVNFNDRAYLDQGLTVDRVALNRGLSHFDSRGTTALYDAVAASADELAHHATQRKQLLLIITDGADNASHLTLTDAIRRVQGLSGPVVYTIGLLYDASRSEYQKAHDDLEALSKGTGGLAYFPRSIDQVGEIASEVARDVRNQYGIGFHSGKSPSLGGYRRIRVEAHSPNHKHLTVRTRPGYFVQSSQKLTQAAADPTSKSDHPSQP
jgi:VWFA-related protein